MTITIRSASTADIARLAALRRAYTAERHELSAGADPDFERRFRAWWEQVEPCSVSWLAEDGALPVGMLSLLVLPRMPSPGRRTGSLGYLPLLYVRPDRRDRGLGRRLLEAAFDHARRHDIAKIILRPTERAAGLYRRAGFRPGGDHLVWRHEP